MVQRSGGQRRSSKTVIPLLPFTGSTTTGPKTAAVPWRRDTGKMLQTLCHVLLNCLEYEWKYMKIQSINQTCRLQIYAGTIQTYSNNELAAAQTWGTPAELIICLPRNHHPMYHRREKHVPH